MPWRAARSTPAGSGPCSGSAPAVVGPGGASNRFRLLKKIYGVDRRRGTGASSTGARAARPGRSCTHAGAQAVSSASGCAATSRPHCCTRRRLLPGRADDRAGRRQQGGVRGSSCDVIRERGHDGAADHPRPRRHRGALRPGDRHRPRHGRLRRAAGRAARPCRRDPHARGRPGRRGAPDRGRRSRHAPGGGPRQWLSFPADASAAPIVAAVAGRTTSRTCRSRSPTSRT